MALGIARIAGTVAVVTAVVAAAATTGGAPAVPPAAAAAAAQAPLPVAETPVPAPAPAPAPAEAEQAPDPAGPRRLTGTAGTSLNAALAAAGVSERIAQDYLRAIGSKISLADGISVADRFDLVVDGPAGSERLLYAGLDRMGALDVQLMRWAADGKSGWVDATGTGAQAEAMRMPVAGGVSSGFGMRTHPVYHAKRFHKGVDLRAGAGTPIRAPADGRVAYAGWAGGYGRQVRLGHADGLATTFSHMSRIAAAPGARVHAGEVIGYVGSTGLSTGPHLHYEVYKNGKAVNPMAARLIGESAMGREERHAFNAQLRALLTSGQGG